MKTKITLMAMLLLSVTAQSFASENAGLKTKKHVQIAPSAAHDALIVKSTENGTLTIVDENGQVSREETIKQGTNEIKLKNVKSARYKIIFSDGNENVIKNLLVK